MTQLALDALDELGDVIDSSAHALYLRGEALRRLKRWQEALEPLEKAARAEPNNVHVRLALGWCYKRTERLDLAVKAMERALKTKRCEALVQYNLACYLTLAGDRKGALEHLAEAISKDARFRELTHDEPDFDPIRSDPEFQALTSIIV